MKVPCNDASVAKLLRDGANLILNKQGKEGAKSI